MATRVEIPTIDVSPLLGTTAAQQVSPGTDPAHAVASSIVGACEHTGVFRIVGHGVDADLRTALQRSAREFFSLDADEKARIAMPLAGRSWRGWFPVGAEQTSGVGDGKEGLYFGTDLPVDDPRVVAGTPLHGPNLLPERPAGLGALVNRWMTHVSAVGRAVLGGLAAGMGLDEDPFDRWCADPTVLFRIFRYPARVDNPTDRSGRWGVGEHTDYGLLTLLAQDGTGGLQVRIGSRWVDVDPDPGALVCNLGDMLELLSGGRFVATPHRVVPPVTDRISMPLFLDPGWDVRVEALPAEGSVRFPGLARPREPRWDGSDVHLVDGPYSQYLLSRVARVFPDLFETSGIAEARSGAAGPVEGDVQQHG